MCGCKLKKNNVDLYCGEKGCWIDLNCCKKVGDLNRRCHNQINENVEVICPSRPPAEDCSSFSVNLFFCISKNLNFVGLHSKLLTLEVMNVRFSSSFFIHLYSFIHITICQYV